MSPTERSGERERLMLDPTGHPADEPRGEHPHSDDVETDHTEGPQTDTAAPLTRRERRELVAAENRHRLIVLGAIVTVIALVSVVVGLSGSGSSGVVLKAGQSAPFDGRTWRAVQGDWSVKKGTWAIKTPGRLFASLLVTDGGSSNLTVQARMPVVATGAGLVFRYQNPFNYWALEAVQGVVSWQLIKVTGGKSQVVANTGLTPTRAGTVVAVNTQTDGTIEAIFNGRLAKSFKDVTLADQRGVGFLAFGARSAKATFADFTSSAATPPPQPVSTQARPSAPATSVPAKRR